MTENIHALKARKAELIEQINQAEMGIVSLKLMISSGIAAGNSKGWARAKLEGKQDEILRNHCRQAKLSKVNAQIKALNTRATEEARLRKESKRQRAISADERHYRLFMQQARKMLHADTFQKIDEAAVRLAVVEVRG